MPVGKVIERDPLESILPDIALAELALADIATDYVRDAIQNGATVAAGEIGIEATFDVINPESLAFLRQYTGLMANRVNRTFVEKIRAALLAGLENGETYNQMRGRVLEAMGCVRNEAGKIVASDGAKYSAERIVRTEINRAENAGRDFQLAEAGATRKVWKANPGACEFCMALDGRTIGIKENFFAVGQSLTVESEGKERTMKLDYADTPHPPLHPACRCVCSYEFSGEQ